MRADRASGDAWSSSRATVSLAWTEMPGCPSEQERRSRPEIVLLGRGKAEVRGRGSRRLGCAGCVCGLQLDRLTGVGGLGSAQPVEGGHGAAIFDRA